MRESQSRIVKYKDYLRKRSGKRGLDDLSNQDLHIMDLFFRESTRESVEV